jgi:hypothetical protein
MRGSGRAEMKSPLCAAVESRMNRYSDDVQLQSCFSSYAGGSVRASLVSFFSSA